MKMRLSFLTYMKWLYRFISNIESLIKWQCSAILYPDMSMLYIYMVRAKYYGLKRCDETIAEIRIINDFIRSFYGPQYSADALIIVWLIIQLYINCPVTFRYIIRDYGGRSDKVLTQIWLSSYGGKLNMAFS